jgi:hypothetical protein
MKVTFYDHDDTDGDGRWDVDIGTPPRVGEMVVLPGRRRGKVVLVQWCFDDGAPFVEVTIERV